MELYFPGLANKARGADVSSLNSRGFHAKLLQLVEQSIRCYHSKISFREDVLGIPLNIVSTENPNGRVYINEISSTLDLLSYTSYAEEGIRKSVWKEPFTAWLPVYISKDHFNKAESLFIKSICSIIGVPSDDFRASDVLEVPPYTQFKKQTLKKYEFRCCPN